MKSADRRRLDALWSKVIRSRAGWKCERCTKFYGMGRGLNAHHIFSKISMSIRWYIHNGISLCYGCHKYAHREPEEFRAWVSGRLAPDRWGRLLLMKNVVKPRVDIKLKEIELKSWGVADEKDE